MLIGEKILMLVNRSAEDLDDWLKRDPISRLEISMLKNNIFSSASLNEFKLEIKNLIHDSWEEAVKDPYPPESALLERVYFNG